MNHGKGLNRMSVFSSPEDQIPTTPATFAVDVVRRDDVDQVDVIGLDHFAPVGLNALVTPVVCERLQLVLLTGAGSLQNRTMFDVEKVVEPLISVGVRAAHESVADHADAKWFGHKLSLSGCPTDGLRMNQQVVIGTQPGGTKRGLYITGRAEGKLDRL